MNQPASLTVSIGRPLTNPPRATAHQNAQVEVSMGAARPLTSPSSLHSESGSGFEVVVSSVAHGERFAISSSPRVDGCGATEVVIILTIASRMTLPTQTKKRDREIYTDMNIEAHHGY